MMTGNACGTFELQMVPQGTEDKVEGVSLGRRSADKQYVGDIEGIGKGEMVYALTNVKTSAAYAAIERVTGSLQGRKGTFLLQHTGTMTASTRDLQVIVVPDSGTGELAGLSGNMKIKVNEGKHLYEFEYALAEQQQLQQAV